MNACLLTPRCIHFPVPLTYAETSAKNQQSLTAFWNGGIFVATIVMIGGVYSTRYMSTIAAAYWKIGFQKKWNHRQ